ncbi:MAG: hypothetical protein ACRDLT_03810 [Solirubrobacteraceae bacterium]
MLVALLANRLAPCGLYLGVNADGGFVQPPAALGEPDDSRATVLGIELERQVAETLKVTQKVVDALF